MRRYLWLRIADHVIGRSSDESEKIRIGLNLLKETSSLRLEDIMQRVGDFSSLHVPIRDAICDVIRSNKTKEAEMAKTMDGYMLTSRQIRDDIAEFASSRCVRVRREQTCDICGTSLRQFSYYVFPCSHAFHAHCLRDEAMLCISEDARARLKRHETRRRQLNAQMIKIRRRNGKANMRAIDSRKFALSRSRFRSKWGAVTKLLRAIAFFAVTR